MRKNIVPRYRTTLGKEKSLSQVTHEFEEFEKSHEIKVKKKLQRREVFVPCQECKYYAGERNNSHRRGKKDIWRCAVGIKNCIHTGQVIN